MNVRDPDPTARLLSIAPSIAARLEAALARLGIGSERLEAPMLTERVGRDEGALLFVGKAAIRQAGAATAGAPGWTLVVVGDPPSPGEAALGMQVGARDWLTPDLDAAEMADRITSVLLRTAPLRDLALDRRRLGRFYARDPLTNLVSHAHFQSAVESELSRCRRRCSPATLVLLDIDGFSRINEEEGHTAGNRLLVDLADLIRSVLGPRSRRIPPGVPALAARYGPDQFAILLPETTKEEARRLAEELARRIEEEETLLKRATVSMGIAAMPEDGQTRRDVIEGATHALRAAKQSGGGRIVLYSPELRHLALTAVPEELLGLQALDETLETRRIGLAFQPIVRASTWSVVGYEVLCRPEHEAIPGPGVLFGLAERAGRVHQLGRLVRSRIAERLSDLPEDRALFVNLHPQELYDPSLLEQMRAFEGAAGRIVLEITESEAITDLPHVRRILRHLKRQGFRFALDDFGAGYSGLAHLDGLAPDFVKLDMGLVRRAAQSRRSRRLVRHVVAFCRTENIEVIAEGIERPEELEVVTDLDCRLVQGFLLAHPADPLPSLRPHPRS